VHFVRETASHLLVTVEHVPRDARQFRGLSLQPGEGPLNDPDGKPRRAGGQQETQTQHPAQTVDQFLRFTHDQRLDLSAAAGLHEVAANQLRWSSASLLAIPLRVVTSVEQNQSQPKQTLLVDSFDGT
jgi:hypothetical protein